ncbi:hypothetical protein IAI18_13750 [Acetobacteraceae bacterium H6797]|nr:hypothetical protein [Acetobacteraceae bacterium H6797]
MRSPIKLGLTVAALLAPVIAVGLFQKAAAAGAKPRNGPEIVTEATTDQMVWNAVVEDERRIFVSGPRWAGGTGPQLARIAGTRLEPYPDAGWNSWRPGDDPSRKFVNINALHQGPDGTLWAVDTGSPTFGGDPLPNAAKLVAIDLASDKVVRVIPLPPEVARGGSYVDDIRFNGAHAYLTDAGNPGLIVLDLATGATRRVLDGHPSTVARADRPIIVAGRRLNGPDGQPLKVQSDPLELSPDGQYLYYGPLEGPWSRVPTRLLDRADVGPATLAAAVEAFADLPPMGGSVMDTAGNLYFSDLRDSAIRKRSPDGTIVTLARDPRLHWVDAMFLTGDGRLLMPAAQLDRVAAFNGGRSRIAWPVALYSLRLDPVTGSPTKR